MKFKEGQDVLVVKNLGPRDGRDRNAYYYGGDIDRVPLKSKGIIEYVSEKKINVKFPNGRTWNLHPDEIRALGDIGLMLDRAHELPRHPVFEIAEQSPVFLINDILYILGEGKVNGNFWQSREEGRRRKKVKKPLEEASGLVELDELAFQRIDSETEGIRKEYAERIKEELDIESEFKHLDVPQFIFSQVFPYLRDGKHKKKIAEMLGQEVREEGPKRPENKGNGEYLEKIADKIYEQVQNKIRDIQGEDLEEEHEVKRRNKRLAKLDEFLGYEKIEDKGPDYDPESVLGRAAKGRNIAIMNNELYFLNRLNGQRVDEAIVIGKDRFELQRAGSSKGLEQAFNFEAAKRIRQEALKNNLSREEILKLLKEKSAGLEDIAGKKEYSEENFGFTQHDGYYYAFLEVPAFAIRSQFDGNYYLFDKARVGIQVYKRYGGIKYSDHIVMVDNNNHPFLHNKEGRFRSLCLGYQEFPTSGRDTGDVIAKRLRRAKEMLMFGYATTDYAERYKLDSRLHSYFDRNLRSFEEIERLGVPVIQGGVRR